VLFGHGWIDLPPHVWDDTSRTFETPLVPSAPERAIDARVRPSKSGLSITLESSAPLDDAEVRAARDQIARMLRVEDDLASFWMICREHAHLEWVARRGGGRLMRSPSLFEDLMKLLFTTNCTWAVTRGMTRRLVDTLGPAAPSGRRAFPSAEVCAERPASFFKDEVRTGYRAEACRALAAAFADGTIDVAAIEDPARPTDEVRRRLLSLRGFGPYAVGQALRLLGRYDDLAIDSWCRSRLAEMAGKKKPPTDRAIARRYEKFGSYQGLALWMDLTAAWHGEGSTSSSLGSPSAALPAAPRGTRNSAGSSSGK
jgi:N-glycosylase/DNA lyase